jgi:hypothetical protein
VEYNVTEETCTTIKFGTGDFQLKEKKGEISPHVSESTCRTRACTTLHGKVSYLYTALGFQENWNLIE